MSPITHQPSSSKCMRADTCDVADHRCSAHHQRGPRQSRLRRVIIPAAFLVLTTLVVLFLEFGDGVGAGHGAGLLRRATGDGTNTNTDMPFVKNKLYLIVVLVGLFLVLVAAIALSAWCCKGAFRNPLCCPCYLCACCGGLACLECISCGLCAEGLEDLNV